MPASIKEVLARVARELEDEEVAEEFEALKGKKPTWEEVRDALAEMPPEERAKVRALLIEEGAPAKEVKPGKNGDDPDPNPDPDPDPDPDKPTRRTRPGRKSQHAYQWYIDDDGRVVRSPTAVIYTGDDEPDEVELLDAEDDEDDDVE